MRHVLSAVVVAVAAACAITIALVLTPGSLPDPSRATAVVPQCPPSDDKAFLLGPALNADSHELLSPRLQALDQKPLWCGPAAEDAFRFIAIFYSDGWRLTVVTTTRRAGTWKLDAAEHTPSTFAVAAPVDHIRRDILETEMMTVMSAIAVDGFWRLPSEEPTSVGGGGYDGPWWLLEGRSGHGYHFVTRSYRRNEIVRSARALMSLARLDGYRIYHQILG